MAPGYTGNRRNFLCFSFLICPSHLYIPASSLLPVSCCELLGDWVSTELPLLVMLHGLQTMMPSPEEDITGGDRWSSHHPRGLVRDFVCVLSHYCALSNPPYTLRLPELQGSWRARRRIIL